MAKAGTSNTRAAAQDAASSIQDQVAGMPAAAQEALIQRLTIALSKSFTVTTRFRFRLKTGTESKP
jgi:hypothetical protein